jgi:uncharacterized protein (DUF362 family)
MNRRTFIKAMGAAAAGMVAAGCHGRDLLTAATAMPAGNTPAPGRAGPPAATVAIMQAKAYERKLVRQQVQAALDALGGISDIIRPGATVALKVNLTGGTACPLVQNVSRIESYWTHPEVVRALGELLRDAGAKQLYIVEGVFTADSFASGGYTDVAQALDATLVDLNYPEPYKNNYTASVGKGWLIYDNFSFHPVLDNVDAFVSVPKMKCHYCCGVTAAMKNLVGLAPWHLYCRTLADGSRSALHVGADGKEDFKPRLPRVVVDLNRARPIQLALVDGITTIDGGENGYNLGTHLQSPGVLLAGKSALAVDAVAVAVMGFDPTAEYPNAPFLRGDNHLNIAQGLGLGTNRLEEIDIKGASVAEVRQNFIPAGVLGDPPFQSN